MPETKNQEEMMDAFISKLTAEDGKLIPTILDHVHEQVSKSIEGVTAKNDELLGELRAQKQTSDELAAMIKAGGAPQAATRDIILSRDDARDPRKYQAAKKQAADAGVELLIAGRNAPAD